MFRLYKFGEIIENGCTMSSQYFLIVAIPEQEPISYSLSSGKTRIGRAPDNDIQILVAEVSTSHCEITGSDSGFQIIDKGSSNGTRVQGQSIANGQTLLNDRDMLLFGETIPGYFVCVEEGVELNPKEMIQSIEEAAAEEEPAVSIAAPAVQSPKLPTLKKVAAPGVPPAKVDEAAAAGASTVMLSKVAPSVSGPAVPKKVAGGAKLPPVQKKAAPNLAPPVQKPAPGVAKLPPVQKKAAPNLAAPKPKLPGGGKVPIVKKK